MSDLVSDIITTPPSGWSVKQRIAAVLAIVPKDIQPHAVAALTDKIWKAAASSSEKDQLAWRELAVELERRCVSGQCDKEYEV